MSHQKLRDGAVKLTAEDFRPLRYLMASRTLRTWDSQCGMWRTSPEVKYPCHESIEVCQVLIYEIYGVMVFPGISLEDFFCLEGNRLDWKGHHI